MGQTKVEEKIKFRLPSEIAKDAEVLVCKLTAKEIMRVHEKNPMEEGKLKKLLAEVETLDWISEIAKEVGVPVYRFTRAEIVRVYREKHGITLKRLHGVLIEAKKRGAI